MKEEKEAMKEALKRYGFKIGLVLLGIMLLYRLYFMVLNLTCPIKGTYAYEMDRSVTLRFENGKYIFEGSGPAYEKIVNMYGNYIPYTLEKREQSEPVYYKQLRL